MRTPTKSENISKMKESKLFLGFSDEDCLSLERFLKPVEKRFFEFETIHDEGDSFGHAELILEGRVVGEKIQHDGHSHLIQTFGERDIIGIDIFFSSGTCSPIRYTAAESTKMLWFPYAALINNPSMPQRYQQKIMDNVARVLADENVKKMYKLEVLSKRALRCRIRTFLSIMEQKTGKSSFHIGMDREQFAQYLCVNRSALSNELGKMQKDGMITFEKDFFTLLRL